ncbi:amino acid ABC transporter substrate-binding protein [Pseudomonas sp. ML96]|uniref:amino acid ABC transporter substrate-binding protein n=1 Tax=Pseudomonas sp. ML96 TaxID=1523503 RepID=UPI0005BC5F8C|nr:amino acid ABC transporter substrate-binding protein [Pseudomonas sp. ML96]
MRRLTWMLACLLLAQPLAAQTLEQIRASQSITLGYMPNMAPFSASAEGEPQGYSIELCRRVTERLRREPGMAQLQVRYRALQGQEILPALQRGEVDLMCSALVETLERRQWVSFSLPIYPAGRGVLVRADASPSLLAVLNGKAAHTGPQWRATINRGLSPQRFAVIEGSTAEDWVRHKLRLFGVLATVVPVQGLDEGVEQVASGGADAFFADKVVLQNRAALNDHAQELQVLERSFELEPVGLVMRRGDDDLRLLVDRELSLIYRSGEIEWLYRRYFGEPSAQVRQLFQAYSRPEGRATPRP